MTREGREALALEAMRYSVARLLTDAAYRERFFAAAAHAGRPGSEGTQEVAARELGLTANEFHVLAQLDARKLDITTEGFAGKRFERVGSAFPRTLALLDKVEPGARSRYLATTAFPPGEEAERATFLGFVRAGGSRGADVQRLLEDLADLEAFLYAAPRPAGLPSYRYRPGATLPRRTPFAELRLHLQGPLATFLVAPDKVPAPYPAAPAEVLLSREGNRVELEDLGHGAGALLAACNGTNTVAELTRVHGPGTEERVQRWLRLGIVEDASGT